MKEVQKLGYSIYDPPPECKDRIKREDVAKILEHFSNKLLAPFFDVSTLIYILVYMLP